MMRLAPISDPISDPVDPIGPSKSRRAEEIISLEAIRTHTKTDDVVTVTDFQLELYRRAAIEAAEQYTGLLLSEQRRIIETVRLPDLPGSVFGAATMVRPRGVKHRMQYPCSDGNVWLYGGRGASSQLFRIAPGAKEIVFPPNTLPANDAACCGPCGPGLLGHDVRIIYLAGFCNVEAIPSGIIVGILKFIAWSVENPGDVMRTVDGAIARNETVLKGSNNTALASGALEMWRQYGTF